MNAYASGYATQMPSPDGHIQIVAGEVSKVLLSGTSYFPSAYIPGGFMRPQTRLDLQGRGFCPATKVQFGSAWRRRPRSAPTAARSPSTYREPESTGR